MQRTIKRKITSKLQRKSDNSSAENSPAKRVTSTQHVYGLQGPRTDLAFPDTNANAGPNRNNVKMKRKKSAQPPTILPPTESEEQTNDEHAAVGQNAILRDDLLYMIDCIVKARSLKVKAKKISDLVSKCNEDGDMLTLLGYMNETMASLFQDACTDDWNPCRSVMLDLASLLIRKSLIVSHIESVWMFHEQCLHDTNAVLQGIKNLSRLLDLNNSILSGNRSLLEKILEALISQCSGEDFVADTWKCLCKLISITDMIPSSSYLFIRNAFEKVSRHLISAETNTILKTVYFYGQKTNTLILQKEELYDAFSLQLFPLLYECLDAINAMNSQTPNLVIFETALAVLSPVILTYSIDEKLVNRFFQETPQHAKQVINYFKSLNDLLTNQEKLELSFLEGTLTVNSYLAFITGQLLLTAPAELLKDTPADLRTQILHSLECFITAAQENADTKTRNAFEDLTSNLRR